MSSTRSPLSLSPSPASPARARARSAHSAARYVNEALGTVAVTREGSRLFFDFGEFASEVGSRLNPDGTTSFITIVPGMSGLEFVVGRSGDKRALTIRDAQHEYVLAER